jgi:phosphoribosyl-dephospho-CoA transferase
MPKMPLRPHDLVRIDEPAPLLRGDEPGWVGAALAAVPWAVVRRAPARPGHVPVGVRGSVRGERFALDVPATAVRDVRTPEQLRSGGPGPDRRPVFRTLDAVTLLLGNQVWGPTGSVGFSLATGHDVTTGSSDLDLVVRALGLPDPAHARDLLRRFADLPARVDAQLDLDGGAVALADVASGWDEVLVRTPAGPVLRSVSALRAGARAP